MSGPFALLAKHGRGAAITRDRSAAELLRDAAAVAAELSPARRPGEQILVLCHDRYRFACALVAALSRGLVVALPPSTQPEMIRALRQHEDVRTVLHDQDDVAARLGIPVADLRADPMGPAGTFSLARAGTVLTGHDGAPTLAGADDVALVLHTSGTTARPKIVPLTHRNVCASARHIAGSLALTPADLCLNVMPLFHIHGLVAALLSSLGVGAAVACSPGFNALQFFTWLKDLRPSWYTAVPTMHQAILTRLRSHADAARAAKLRFIRSSSASLPPQVMLELEAAFDCPVIEAYGMTEASHQMASNALPPGKRKPGAVGLPAGPKIAIMDEAGHFLPQGTIGEVVIQGPNVTAGYDNNPDANLKAFADGWFRTGDQGRFDEDGYLFLTGRLKEIINRGGEKISPIEVDTILMDHPAVEQVVTFAIPHPMLGEDVGAVVVLRAGMEATERELRDFVGKHAADFKVPRKVVFVTEIPKGATGKLQRIGLAAKLGLAEAKA